MRAMMKSSSHKPMKTAITIVQPEVFRLELAWAGADG
jgi:hypothetical protein